MKPVYARNDTRAIADVAPVPHLGENANLITRINVPLPSRGQGVGSDILREITDDADVEGATLYVAPVPSGGLNNQQLVAWYARNGFVPANVPDAPGLLKREPKKGPKVDVLATVRQMKAAQEAKGSIVTGITIGNYWYNMLVEQIGVPPADNGVTWLPATIDGVPVYRSDDMRFTRTLSLSHQARPISQI